jgi:hypothetical protein
MSESYFMGQILFGAIGSGAVIYGKNLGRTKPLLLGLLLAGFGFFITDTTVLWVVGGVLTAALVYFKEPS